MSSIISRLKKKITFYVISIIFFGLLLITLANGLGSHNEAIVDLSALFRAVVFLILFIVFFVLAIIQRPGPR